MKVKKYLSVFAVVCAGALTLAGCSDYDNGYNEAAIKFQEEFKNTFGDIDPEQDWNLAERATVTVNTQTTSNIKIYALRGNEYSIVGNYEGVNGTRMLGVDVIEGTRNLIVTDGRTAQKCAPRDVVAFSSMSTRTIGTGNEAVGITKITDPNGLQIGTVTYPMYKEATEADYDAMKEVIPEIGYRKTYTNLNNVVHDFTYISQGKFIIYPYYWETSSANTIGIYYYDNNNERQEVDVYTIKSGDEFQYHEISQSYTNGFSLENATNTANAQLYKDYSSFTWTDRNNNLVENLGLPNGNLLSRFTDLTLDVTMKKWTPAMRVVFYKSDGSNKSVNIVNPSPSENGEQQVTQTINLQALVNQDSSWRDYLENCSKVSLAGNNYEFEAKTFSAPNSTTVIGDVVLNDVYFSYSSDGSWKNYSQNFCSEIFTNNIGSMVRGQGIVIDIEPGTRFGMYLKKTDIINNEAHPYTFYSEGKLNNPEHCGSGVTDDGQGHVTQVPGLHPCYASTFTVSALEGQMFLGFEDWPNDGNASDFDLNDVVFAFSGSTPIIINEDPEPNGTWMLACEDLGGTFDRDYNDVIFKVRHISGETTAYVTPVAAGGTLASYVFHVPEEGEETCLGEIHQLFGFEPAKSGEYEAYNVIDTSRGTEGQMQTINVPEDWTMAYYSTDTFGEGSLQGGEGYQNMGGFEIRTLPKGTDPVSNNSLEAVNALSSGASRIPAPDMGAAPYIICFPASYVEKNTPSLGKKTETFWAWPREFMTIDGCYPDFPGWVRDHSNRTYGTWYQRRKNDAPTVSELKIVTDMPIQQGGGQGDPDESDLNVSISSTSINQGGTAILTIQTSSSGNITFSVSPAEAGSVEGNTFTASSSYHGSVTITVNQAATNSSEEGSASVTLTINEVTNMGTQDNNDFGFQWYTQRGDHYSGGDSKERLTMHLAEGQLLNVSPYLYNGTGNITCTFDAGGTGTTCEIPSGATMRGQTIKVTGGGTTGYATLILHYEGDATYKPKDIAISIDVSSATRAKILHNGNALTYADGRLSCIENHSWFDANQIWVIEQVPNDEEYYYLYNEGAGKYLYLIDDGNQGRDNNWSPAYSERVPVNDQHGKFKMVPNNGIQWQVKYTGGYMGSNAENGGNDGIYIYLNKTGNDVYTWNLDFQ